MVDFSVHHIEWLNSSTTDVGGKEAFDFSISHELVQTIKHPTHASLVDTGHDLKFSALGRLPVLILVVPEEFPDRKAKTVWRQQLQQVQFCWCPFR